MSKLTLVSHPTCPYVQRAAIALLEKGIAFERIDIDLENKPEWFLALSPLGKVPLLKVDDAVIFESAVICEYIEDTTDAPLHPGDPLLRAKHRAMIEYAGSCLIDSYFMQIAPDRTSVEQKLADLKKKLAWVETTMSEGPFYGGAALSLVDAAFAPLFRPFDLAPEWAFLNLFEGTPKCERWSQALAARPSVKGAVPSDYRAHLLAFLAKKGSHLASLVSAS